MTQGISQALVDGDHIAVEAGTGVGKSMAYLVPAVLSGRKVVVTTATKVLQDQLAKKDLPQIAAVLSERIEEAHGRALRHSVLKGRSNYVCLLKLRERANQVELNLDESTNRRARGTKATRINQLGRIREWVKNTETGDGAELDFQPDQKVWSKVSATSRECVGADNCPAASECFSERARAKAAEADIVITNHHLYLIATAHLPDGTLLPEHDVVIIDEAHQLESTATSVIGVSFSPGTLINIIGELSECDEVTKIDGFTSLARTIRQSANDLSSAFEPFTDERIPLEALQGSADSEDDAPLAVALARADAALEDLLRSFPDSSSSTELSLKMFEGAISDTLNDIRQLQNADDSYVAWIQDPKRFPTLRLAPLDVSEFLIEHLWTETQAVLASATLPERSCYALGLPEMADYEYTKIESDFEFEENSRLYCEKNHPDPNSPAYRKAVLATMTELISAIGGRTLALFTSWNALNETADALPGLLNSDIQVLRQGDDLTNAQLIDELNSNPATVVCGTMSFWQGVDVPGSNLSLLVIDRLPFTPPNDPLHKARREAAEKRGENPFMEIDVPIAANLLAQGAGRLIRTKTDRGVVAVMDPRLATKNYRKEILESVPPMKKTIELEEAVRFLELNCGG